MKKKTITGVSVVIALLIASCVSTRTMWIPVYKISGVGENRLCSFDPGKLTLINPTENVTYAFFKAQEEQGIVFANKNSVAFSEKVTYTVSNDNMVIDESRSTKRKISYLNLSKSFYYTHVASAADTMDLLYYHDDETVIFNHAKLTNGKTVQYDLFGCAVGTSPVDQVTIVDVLPRGLNYSSSQFHFSAKNGVFKHKIINQNGREALVLDAELARPLDPGNCFTVRVSLNVSIEQMEKYFKKDQP
jgi:uncharacterized repeat protein (TIGR01451 family)